MVLNLFFVSVFYPPKALSMKENQIINKLKNEKMNIKKSLIIGYRILCVTITLIEAAELGKTIYGKYKNKKSSVKHITPTDTTTVEDVCE